MELEKRQIQKKKLGKCYTDQFVLDEDYNVPDSKEDVGKLILSDGKVKIDNVRRGEHALFVNGKVEFHILYVTDGEEKKMCAMEGKLPFEEPVYMENEEELTYVAEAVKTDFQVRMIHSRKINIKTVVELEAYTESVCEDELVVDAQDALPLYKKQRQVNLLKLYTSNKDSYRIKEEFTLPPTKETIQEILWCDVNSGRMDTRIGEGEILLEGELSVFCFYESEDGKPDWVETRIPYEGRINCPGVETQMYHHVKSNLCDILTEMRVDEDGEMRCVGVEATIELRYDVYEEESMELLEDVYCLKMQCIPERKKVNYEEPVMQNHSKCKVTEQLSLPELSDDILQICHSSGTLQTERMVMTKEGVMVEGVLHISFLYVKADDTMPYAVWQGMVPFFHVISANETGKEVRFDISGTLEQLSVSLLGENQIEVKASLAFGSLLRKEIEAETICDMQMQELDMEEIKRRPGIVGYVTKDGDSLWSLAKAYNTTIESIKEVNQLEEENIKPGQRILIFKENMSIL